MEGITLNSSFGVYLFVLPFKLSCLCSSDEYLIYVEPYRESGTNIDKNGLDQGPDAVLGLIDKCKLPKRSTVTFDNLFTALPLFDELSENNMDLELFKKIDCEVHH